MTTARVLAAVLVGIALGPLSGCASYYVVQSRFVEADRVSPTPEVTVTPLYGQVLDAVQNVALRPPDTCEDRTAAQTEGQARSRAEVLRTRCGVEMAELERALAKGGFLVVSWSAIQDKAASDDVAPMKAAAELGVDALLQVNSLERSVIDPGLDARWERRFYASSRHGEVGAPAPVDRARRERFESLIAPEEQRILPGQRLAATIDANAVLVANGASFWFYRWTVVDQPPTDPLAEVYVVCDSDPCERVREPAVSAGDEGPTAGSIEAVSSAGKAADRDQVTYHRLIRTLVEDLVARFSGRR